MSNPIHDIIREVVKPVINSIAKECDGTVSAVDYIKQTVNIFWMNHEGGSFTSKNVPIPRDGNGVYAQSIKIGDRVKIGFVNGSHVSPYISIVYKNDSSEYDYQAKNGAGIMKGINYMMGSD